MFLGVDVGSSSVKALIIDDAGVVCAESSASLTMQHPAPLWSEQNPRSWLDAAKQAVVSLPSTLRLTVAGVGLSGQMHGATLLDERDRILRPAMLWNDGRAFAECADLEAEHPELLLDIGNRPMAGFTAPKLLWLQRHEPEAFARIRHVLLPKDYLRRVWTGELATDLSDASGTWWLDIANRCWHPGALAATDMRDAQMPALYEGSELTGTLRPSIAEELGLPRVPVVAGAGDQAASAIGCGVTQPGQAALSLGTSGVIFVATDAYQPNVAEAAHAFCHALPNRWHQMAVLLNAASAVDWAASLVGFRSVAAAFEAAAAAGTSNGVLFLPYLTGERTPLNDPHARGALFGLTPGVEPAHIVHAAIEGVAFAFGQAKEALGFDTNTTTSAVVTGGGSKSAYWVQLLADVLDMTLHVQPDSASGAALGSALLARHAIHDDDAFKVPSAAASSMRFEPRHTQDHRGRERQWRELYPRIKTLNQGGNRD